MTTDSTTLPDEARARMEAMIDRVEEWAAVETARLTAAHDQKHGEQLDLLRTVEHVSMKDVREYLLKLNAIEVVLARIGEKRTELYAEMRGKGLPEKSVRSALKIARTMQKYDSTTAVFEACIAVALSLMPADDDEDDEARARREAKEPRDGQQEEPHA